MVIASSSPLNVSRSGASTSLNTTPQAQPEMVERNNNNNSLSYRKPLKRHNPVQTSAVAAPPFPKLAVPTGGVARTLSSLSSGESTEGDGNYSRRRELFG